MVPDFPKKARNGKRGVEEESPPTSSNEQEPLPKKSKAARSFNFALHPKRKIALRFLYFGWEYDGLVQQANTENTVEKHLINALLKTKLISDPKDCDLSRCGRTDKGVSAFKQVAALVVRSSDPSGDYVYWPEETDPEVLSNYKTTEELPYIRMLNGVLPATIRVTAWAPLPRNFSARHGCNKRVYKYSMPRANLDVEKMQEACDYLVGEHDFRNFCQIDNNETRVNATYSRRIFAANVRLVGDSDSPYDLIELTVEGSGFLWHMIRYIVSILHDVGQGNEKPQLVTTMLDVEKTPCRPQYALAVETPLCLFDCKYDSYDLKWQEDELSSRKNVVSLQSTWAEYATKAQLLKNMIDELGEAPIVDINKGLLQFTADRPLSGKYVAYLDRPKCESLESRLEKFRNKLKNTTME